MTLPRGFGTAWCTDCGEQKVNGKCTNQQCKRNIQKTEPRGIKIKYLLFGGVVALTIIGSIIFMGGSEIQTETSIITEPSQPLPPPPNTASSSVCKKAYELGPNDWWKKHCQ